MPYIPWHLQLLSPGTYWTWRHSICKWLCWVGTSIIIVCHCEIFFSMRRTWSVHLLLLVISEIPQTAVHSYRVKFVRTIPMMSHSKEMFISDRTVLNTMCTSSLQGLVQCELFSRFIHLVNHGACLVFVNISITVPKGEEQTSINGKMLNSHSSSGWQV